MKDFFEYTLFEAGNYSITVKELVEIFFIVLITKIILRLLKKAIFRLKKVSKEREEDLYTVNKIFSYVIWTIAIILILNTLGIKISVLLTGSAALLVGIGLGLQQTFNDFVSGIILLFEGKTKVGDILEVEGRLMKLSNIGLRTTEGIDRDGVSIIIPNSKIVTDKVINWSYQKEKTIRFRILVGVAYGSDVELVIRLLEESAREHPGVSKKMKVEARFIDFGNSSLDFELLFFSKTIFRIRRIESDIRRTINQKFTEHNITIPFPQMDVHLQTENRP